MAGFLFVDEDGFARPERGAFDDDGHGTHTAGLICGGSVRGRPAIGVCKDARIYSAAVIENGRVPVRMLVGLEWLSRQPIRVLHMPLGVVGMTALLDDALRRIRARGILPIAAVGNHGSGRYDTPACYPQVLSVGACDEHGEPASTSGSRYLEGTTRCLDPDVLAPGVLRRSASPGREFERRSGSSMACAHVVGVAARLFAAKPSATVSEVESAIVRSARPPAPGFEHRVRHGVVDLDAALELLARGPKRRPPHVPIAWQQLPRCDPKLGRTLDLRLGGDELEAIVLPRRGARGGPRLERLVDRCARAIRRRRYDVRVLPGGHGAVVRGHYELLRKLLREDEVAYLHATELDVMGWR